MDSIDFLLMSKATFPEPSANVPATIQFAQEHTVYFNYSDDEGDSDWGESENPEDDRLTVISPSTLENVDEQTSTTHASEEISPVSSSSSPIKKKVKNIAVCFTFVFHFLTKRDSFLNLKSDQIMKVVEE